MCCLYFSFKQKWLKMKKFASLEKSLTSHFDCTPFLKGAHRTRCTSTLGVLICIPVDRSQALTAPGDLARGVQSFRHHFTPSASWQGGCLVTPCSLIFLLICAE